MLSEITSYVEQADDRLAAIQEIRRLLHQLSPQADHPVDNVVWLPLDLISANDYNPNQVARQEMQLLLRSIDADGYTQPIVVADERDGRYTIVDGFHRYYVLRHTPSLLDSTNGLAPCVILTKNRNERMAATIRHNRARGKHSVDGMANTVFKMLDGGMSDPDICNALGLEPEELLRLKHITGFSKLYANGEYSQAWITQRQLRIREKHRANTR